MRGRNGTSLHRFPSIDVPAMRSFNNQGRQHACGERSRIDSNSVRLLVYLMTNRMSVDDDEAVIAVVAKEWLADPAQVGLALMLQANARAYPGMHEQVIAKAARIDECLEELDMACRNYALNRLYGRHIIEKSDLLWIGAVTPKALRTPKSKPTRDQLSFSSDDPQKDLLMITEKED